MKVALVTSKFNHEITEQLHKTAVARLKERNISDENIVSVFVPGAVEIPLMAQHFAKQKKYDAIICMGAVIRGETSHYDYVCQQVSYGCQRVALDNHMPVIFGILTTENEEQAQARINTARDWVDAAFHMVSLLR
ncbi:MAG TPA: 6,7-dimethyl-8-ribityllumazine synthase [Gammaproteobacteria bacterium]|nr:6,7-dimethyl-8-ribityllumazine synthase [Gammaproteobacteria bacterium]